MNKNVNASAFLQALRTLSASVLMVSLVALSFPPVSFAQEESAPVEPAIQTESSEPANQTDTDPLPIVDEEPQEPLPNDPPLEEEEALLLEVQALGVETAKINICHKTESLQNPWNAQRVNESSWSTHQSHGDFLYEGPVNPQNNQPTSDAWCGENAPQEPPAPSVTISAAKIVCEAEQYLPNRSGGADITASTATDWLSQNSEHCWLEEGYTFQWAPHGTPDPADNGTTPLGAPWTSFGPTNQSGVATVNIPLASANGTVQVREVLQDGDLPFAGESGNAVSPELYCHTDVAGTDNWEWIQGLSSGATYHCVAWNVHPRPVEDSCDLYSDTETLVGDDAAVLVSDPHDRWTAVLDELAKWIWGEDPTALTPNADEVEVFTKVFLVEEAASGATLTIAADNGYKVTLNGEAVCADMSDGPEGSHNYQQADTCSIDGEDILVGVNNILEFTVTNYQMSGETPANNPGGLRYALTIQGAECGVPEIPDEPENTCLVGDNEGVPQAAVPFGTTPGGEDTLQEILDAAYGVGAPDASTEQDNFQEWNGSGQDVTFTVENLSDSYNSGYRHVFGYYVNGGSFTPVFANGAVGAPHSGVDMLAFGAAKTFEVENVVSIAFGIKAWNGSSYVGEYSTDYVPGEAHAVVYNVDDNEYAIGFEDLPFSTGDEDYNDIVVSLHVDRCEDGYVCNPEEELLANGGFESPSITTNWDIVPSGTTGLSWLVSWLPGANSFGGDTRPEIANAEFQAGVNGWLPHEGEQYAELDSDWYGPTDSTSGEPGAVTMSQTVDTQPGQEYTFSFWFSPRPDQGASENKVEALVDGVVVYTTPAVAGNGSQTAWTKHTVTFVADEDGESVVALRDAAGNPNNSLGSFVDDARLSCVPEEEDDTATLIATKIVCPTEASLPNWGAGNIVTNITATTDEEFLLAHPECHVETWDFQWATDAAGDPEDNGTVALAAPWTTFTSGVPVEVPEGINLRVREVLKPGYIPFTGQNTDQSVSAEMYCAADVLHYDNWEFIDNTDASETYYCIAINAPVGQNGGEDPTTSEETVVVDENNLNGWFFFPENVNGGQTGTFVEGPDTAPLGEGSAALTVTANDQGQVLGMFDLAGTRLDAITSLAYSTYRDTPGPALPALQFEFDNDVTDGDTTFKGRLVYEPYLAHTVTEDVWQTWNPMDNALPGNWWFSNATQATNSGCAMATPCTWSEVLTYAPNGGLRSAGAFTGAVLFKVGSGGGVYAGHVDEFVIGIETGLNTHTTTYDFEPVDDEGGDESTPQNEPRNRSGNTRGSTGGSSGIVAGATTSCEPLLTSYLHIGWNNDPGEVSKLQEFLNAHLGLSIPVTGFFGPMTFAAVSAFQAMYGSAVLAPWLGIEGSGVTSTSDGTGFVYQTTRWQINNLWCPGSEAYPDTLI